jgi:diguanylate cyclase (GGDEF)-like protein
MARRRDLPTRTRQRLTAVVDMLEPPATRWTVLVGGLSAALALHATTGDPRVAWIAAPLALLGGLAAGFRVALVVAIVAATGHAVLDVALGLRPGEVLGVAIRSAVLPFLALVGTVGADIERQRHRALERAVSEDPVTGLLNVRVFYEELAALRSAGQPFTILLADLRGMRDLNDRYGHPTGTEAMRVLAHVLRRAAGPDARLARLGSDEIAVVFPGAHEDRCREVVATVVARLPSEQVLLPDGEHFSVHASYGIAQFPQDGPDEVAILRVADRVKDRAKATGLDPIGVPRRDGGDASDASGA